LNNDVSFGTGSNACDIDCVSMNNDFTESFVWIDASDFVHLFAPVFVYSALEIAAWQFLKKRRDGQSS
jgi:hypothetical protein